MIQKVAFTMYPVENLERARAFYEGTLKLRTGKISSGGKWVEYDLPGGGCFCLTTLAEGVKPSANSGGSVAFEVDDLDTLVAELKAKNVRIKVDTFPTPVCKIAVILDSEGNALTLHQLKR
jgi:predicted enzyme related to lactoylglutathione lyase